MRFSYRPAAVTALVAAAVLAVTSTPGTALATSGSAAAGQAVGRLAR